MPATNPVSELRVTRLVLWWRIRTIELSSNSPYPRQMLPAAAAISSTGQRTLSRISSHRPHVHPNLPHALPLFPMSKSTMQVSPTSDVLYGGINSREHFWVKHYTWLESRGYRLRPRYAPDWVPSWWGTDELADLFEDGKTIFVRAIFSHIFR